MSWKLYIAARDTQPEREEQYPSDWLLFKQREGPIAVHIERDPANTPHVVNKIAASISSAALVAARKKKKPFGIVSRSPWKTR